MKIFGWEITIKRIEKPVELTKLERLYAAVDAINLAWADLESQKGNTIRPWIIWENKEVVVTERKGSIEVIYSKK